MRRFVEAEEEEAMNMPFLDSLWLQGIQARAEREVAEEAAALGQALDPLRVLARVAVEIQETEKRVEQRRTSAAANQGQRPSRGRGRTSR